MAHALPLLLSMALSAAPELTPADSVFAEASDDVLSQFASQATSESLVRGQMPGGDAFQSAASGWTVEAGTIILSRLDPKQQVILIAGAAPPGRELANANQFKFDHEAGWQVNVRKQLGELFGVEVRYFEIDGWEASLTANGNPGEGVFVPYNGGGFINGFGVPNLRGVSVTNTLKYTSQLTNFEANLRLHLTDDIVGIVGYRRLELHDRLTIHQDDRGAGNLDFTHDIRASNDLDGAQIGAEALLLDREYFRVDGVLKAGVFNNRASNKLAGYGGPGFGNAVFATGRRADVTSFVGEAGLTGTVRLTQSISLRAGYLCLWIDEIAQPTEQPVANGRPPGLGTPDSGPARHVDAGSYQIMQGGQFSIEFAY